MHVFNVSVPPTAIPTKIDPSVLKTKHISDVNHLREHPDQVAIDDGIRISGSPAGIALYVMVVLLLSAFALLLACCCWRRRRVHRVLTVTPVAATALDKESLTIKAKEAEANGVMGVSNEIYTIAGALPPAYEELFRSLGMIAEVSSPKREEAIADVSSSEAGNEPAAEVDEGSYEHLRRNSSTSGSGRYTALKKDTKADTDTISQPEGAAGTIPGDCYLTPIDVALSSMYASVKRKHEAKE